MQASPGPDTMVARRDGLISERVLDDVVVLDPETSRYVRLNASAAALWEYLEAGPASVSDLADVLRERLGAPEVDAVVDATSFAAALATRDLVALVPS